MKWFIIFLLSTITFAQETEKHETDEGGWEVVSEKTPKETLESINLSYLKNVKPIFQKKCLSCHGIGNPPPWYSKIPGIKQLILNNIKEAKEHMDMTDDFPFSGHGTPEDDLEELAEIVEENTMPPFMYKMMHWRASLNENDKKAINEWVEDSLKLINPKKEKKK